MLIKYGIPVLFLVLWSTGFVGAKYGLPSAEPFTFLAVRMLGNLACLGLLLPFFNVKWPTDWAAFFHAGLVGILIHGVYLGGIFAGIHNGLPASITAIIVGLQPLVTVLFAVLWLNESLTWLKTLGLVVGFVGIVLVIAERGIGGEHMSTMGLWLCVGSLFGISIGTIYQKKFCARVELLPGIFIQYAANCGFMWVLAFSFETRVIHWNFQFMLALGWLVLALSIGAVLLLMWLIRQGEAGRVASLFYLVPPLVAIETWFLFDEKFGLMAAIGIVCCVAGIAMVLRNPKPNP